MVKTHDLDKTEWPLLKIYIHHRSQNLRHLFPRMGLKLGAFGFFLIIKITAFCQVCMSLHVLLSACEKCVKCCMHTKTIDKLVLCVFFEDPWSEPHGWRYHYMGQYKWSGIPGVHSPMHKFVILKIMYMLNLGIWWGKSAIMLKRICHF